MFRAAVMADLVTAPSPHARGDVPLLRNENTVDQFFSPRPWGCSVRMGDERLLQLLLPTPVGMFRLHACISTGNRTSPHARGDVPLTSRSRRSRPGFSPRPWGCSVHPWGRGVSPRLLPTPVGMFRIPSSNVSSSKTSPHARGDVPKGQAAVFADDTFSPRPWGCSLIPIDATSDPRLLPTPVGMFLLPVLQNCRTLPSPHARGDVPAIPFIDRMNNDFSPRPWGCSVVLHVRARVDVLLPTPVGMFRSDALRGLPPLASPHARGDVPGLDSSLTQYLDFSPRPWGCSAVFPDACLGTSLLPTPVGMFRGGSTPRCRRTPSPHARGDVPDAGGEESALAAFSPRPWGCSVLKSVRRGRRGLLPTPVGMFPRHECEVRVPSPSPHARGDVP